MSSTEEHNALVKAVLRKYRRHAELRLFLNSKVRIIHGKAQANPGLGAGTSDLIGVWKGPDARGRFCAFECKTGNATETKEQRMFRTWIKQMGAFACVFHSLEEFDAAVERLSRGESK